MSINVFGFFLLLGKHLCNSVSIYIHNMALSGENWWYFNITFIWPLQYSWV